MQVDIPGALRDLGRLVDRIAELLEWQKLAQQERRMPFSTSFDLEGHIPEDLRDLRAAFLSADMTLRELLGRDDLAPPAEQRRIWQRELEQIERRFAEYSATDAFINS